MTTECMSTSPPTRSPAPSPGVGATLGLLALAIGGFGIGLTEFVISGLLSDVAADLHVPIPTAGALVWGYALSVVVGAFTVTSVLSRRPPKQALLVLLALFVIGNLVVAVAPSFGLAVVGRVVTALCHGGFFGIGAVVAGDLVAPQRKASAIAVMFGGLTLANVLGVPFGTFIGDQLGWRAAFWAISGIGALGMVVIALAVPRLPAQPPTQGSRYGVLLRPQVVVSMVLTMTMFGGLFGAFIYVEPLVRHVTGLDSRWVPWLLMTFGAGLFLGNLLGGRWADRDLSATLRRLSIALPLVLLAYGLTAGTPAVVFVVLFVMGLVGFAATPALQLRVMRFAGDAPTMASAANIAAFNLGNAIAAALGAGAISVGLGWRSPIWVGLGMALIATVLTHVTHHNVTQEKTR